MPSGERKDICDLAQRGLSDFTISEQEEYERASKIWDDFCLTDEDRERLAAEEAARWVECDACLGDGGWAEEWDDEYGHHYEFDQCSRCDGKGKVHKSVLEAEKRKKQLSSLYWHVAPGGIKDGQHRAVVVEGSSIKSIVWAYSTEAAIEKAREVADAHNATLPSSSLP